MGAVRSSLVLNDGMSPALRRINNAMSLVLNNFEAVQKASGKSMNTANIASARQEISRANMALDQMEQNYHDCNNQQQNLNNHINMGARNANGLLGKIKGMAATYIGMKSITGLFGLSDTMSSSKARLEMIVDDGGSVAELQNKIYASAQSSRAEYTSTMATVAKLGMVAGDAFSNNNELIKFSELVNKNFVVGGASATEQASAMYQLTQALGSGRLQGDEYRSIIENAPLLAKGIEDYMKNTKGLKGTMKEWASDGLLTANVIKAAVFKTADDVEERFSKMPMKWSQVWTNMKNRAIRTLDPVLLKINELANNPKVKSTIDSIIGALVIVVSVALDVFGAMCEVYNFVANNWGWIAPIIVGIALALMAYYVAVNFVKIAEKASAFWTGVTTIAKIIATAMTWLFTKATLAQAGAQWGLNAALYACPLVWIIGIIIVVILIIYAVIGAINKATGSTISATGVIFGSICWLAAVIWNTLIGVINAIIQFLWTNFVEPWIGIIEWVLNVFNGGFDSFGDAVANLIGNIISWFLSLGKVVTTIIDAIFGTNWTAGLNSLQENVLAWGKNDSAITLSREAPTIQSLTGGKVDRWNYSDAWNTGYSAGEKVDSSISDMLKFDQKDYSTQLGDISGNTKDIAGSVEISEENLKYLRDIAERDVINRFTTAEIKIDQTNHNNINSDMDLDGVVDKLTIGVNEAMEKAAEGVHS